MTVLVTMPMPVVVVVIVVVVVVVIVMLIACVHRTIIAAESPPRSRPSCLGQAAVSLR